MVTKKIIKILIIVKSGHFVDRRRPIKFKEFEINLGVKVDLKHPKVESTEMQYWRSWSIVHFYIILGVIEKTRCFVKPDH